MAVFMVEKCIVKPDKLGEWTAFVKKVETYVKGNPELFKEVKSHKWFSHMLGGNWGGYVEMWEANSLEEIMKSFNRVMQDKEYMTKIYPEGMALIIPGSNSIEIWNSVP
jgi:hypothetical protein